MKKNQDFKLHISPYTTYLNARQRWAEGWRFVRLLTNKWWNVGNITAFPGDSDQGDAVLAARRQAPLAFECLVVRNQLNREKWEVWKGNGWHHFRPGKYFKRTCPLP